MTRNRALIPVLLGLSMIGGVGLPTSVPAQPTASVEPLVGTEWQLTRLNGRSVLDDVQTTLIVESRDRLVGNGGCNSYFASMTVNGRNLTLGEIGSTMMGCEPGVMDQEARFFEALQQATHFKQRGNTLRIYSAGFNRPLRFTQTSATPPTSNMMLNDLIGTQWQLTELDGRPVSDAIQTTLKIESGDDSPASFTGIRLVGNGGCNGYFAQVTSENNRLAVEPIASTMAMCEPVVMDQEAQFFLVLQQATRAEKSEASLLIYSDASDHPLRFAPLSTTTPDLSTVIESLVGTEWRLEDLNGAGVIDYAQTTLRFESSDRITGQGGCNRYFGSLTVEGETLSLGPIGSTRMACAPAIMDQESRFVNALQTATRLEQQGSYLFIYGSETDMPLRFTQLAPLVE